MYHKTQQKNKIINVNSLFLQELNTWIKEYDAFRKSTYNVCTKLLMFEPKLFDDIYKILCIFRQYNRVEVSWLIG